MGRKTLFAAFRKTEAGLPNSATLGSVDAVEEYREQVQLLTDKVRRLEVALGDMVAASDEVITDMRRNEQQLRSDLAQSSHFAAEWESFQAEPETAQRFGILDTDQRARRWLLTS